MSPAESTEHERPRCGTRFLNGKRVACAVCLVGVVAVLMLRSKAVQDRQQNAKSVGGAIAASPSISSKLGATATESMTMADVIDRARQVRQSMAESLHDYTATFVKQERSQEGELGPRSVIAMKVQTPFRDPSGTAPKRVFLNFIEPAAKAGRKVIWGEDLYDGKMAVHEVGMLLGLKTIWLDPNGMIAMQGQRYPISEIGMIKLVEKLIQRGEQDLDNPNLKITMVPDHDFGGLKTELLQVQRQQPSGQRHDFSLAEIVLDPERMLILQFRSFGWPDSDSSDDRSPPLLESYSYEDVQVNVGLSEMDFDVKNPEYGFPAF